MWALLKRSRVPVRFLEDLDSVIISIHLRIFIAAYPASMTETASDRPPSDARFLKIYDFYLASSTWGAPP